MVTKQDILSEPVRQIDLERIATVQDLVEAWKDSSIQSRSIATCAVAIERALADKDRPTVFLGLAGALIAGGLRKVIRDLVEYGIVDGIVTIGAIPYQDFYWSRGYKHFKCSPQIDDIRLREYFIDRIYDTLVDEEKLRETDAYIGKLSEKLPAGTYSSREFMALLGEHSKDPDSILGTAAKWGIPVFVPALNDSSIGIGLTGAYVKARKAGKQPIIIDPIRDNWELTQIKIKSKKTAVIYVAGGVPKNYLQQTEVIAETLGYDCGGHHYAIQFTADAPHWGGLSGCTFEEAQSWGKIHKYATKAVAYVEATIGLSLVASYLIQKGVWKGRTRLRYEWDGDTLKRLVPVAASKPPRRRA